MEVTYSNKKYTFRFGMGQKVTKGIAIIGGISIAIFLISQTDSEFFYPVMGFIPSYFLGKLRLWQFITANFVHGSLTHLIVNMLGLYLFGGPVEQKVGKRELIKYFLICGTGGYVVAYFLWLIGIIPNNLIIGSSAGVYGLLLAFAFLYPNQKVLLFLAIPMQAKWMAVIFGCFELLMMFKTDGISHIGHLAGILIGLAYLITTKHFAPSRGIESVKI
ncbi:MAG: rhomboid family intramembrane serine protease [Desulfobacteraceae bacterium]|nr:MAG: rhomboid family intramembrane serine protease [Desulfobacteraceae bacterium]